MKILSLYTSLPSTVSLYVDGNIVAATHEERFTRRKNDETFPCNSISYCLDYAGISASELDAVAIASYKSASFDDTVTCKSQWSVSDYLDEQYQRWLPSIDGSNTPPKSLVQIFPEKVNFDSYPGTILKDLFDNPSRNAVFHKLRENIVADHLGIDKSLVHRIEHHRCHAAYSYYASPFRGEQVLALTIDGSGDGLNATIGVFDEDGVYTRFYQTSECFIGRIYRYMTLLLGMKPNEHEFKVMGLAPYGKAKYSEKALSVFRETLYVDGIDFKWNKKPTDSYFWFKERLEGIRFDNIAYALQAWVEELLLQWVENAVTKFGIHKIVIAGGVAMNIKAMGEIAKLDCVHDIFVGGSASDESMAISAGICLAEDLANKTEEPWVSSNVAPFPNIYLGPSSSKIQEDQLVSSLSLQDFSVTSNPDNKTIVKLLADGMILARCVDRMEFGQRSLGNRSILADPVQTNVKERINAAIKNRDFWMPFAPIILDTFSSIYLHNPKNLSSPYMTLAFDTTPIGYDCMIAACHPADRTARPQILERQANPDLYDLLHEFSLLTGRGALLNTSFNLHGYPIVNNPVEALYVFENSQLDGLLLNNYLIMKKA